MLALKNKQLFCNLTNTNCGSKQVRAQIHITETVLCPPKRPNAVKTSVIHKAFPTIFKATTTIKRINPGVPYPPILPSFLTILIGPFFKSLAIPKVAEIIDMKNEVPSRRSADCP